MRLEWKQRSWREWTLELPHLLVILTREGPAVYTFFTETNLGVSWQEGLEAPDVGSAQEEVLVRVRGYLEELQGTLRHLDAVEGSEVLDELTEEAQKLDLGY